MNNQGSFKNRKHLWEDLAPSPELRPNAQSNSVGYKSIPTAEESSARQDKPQPHRPRLGFARRTAENLDPIQAPEPQYEEELDDFRPSRRFRWRPRSATGWATLAIAAVILLGAVTTGAILVRNQILRNTRFNLATAGNVQMSGASEVSRADLLPVFSQDLGHNVFTVPLSARRKELEQISWVQHATVMRVLPNQLRISVVERTPVAFVRSTPEDQQIGLVDADGVLLKMPASLVAQRHYSFPVVSGIDAKDSLTERRKRMVVYTRMIQELDSGNRKLSEQISEIDLRDPNDARVLMPEAGSDILAHFGADHFLERYQTYQSHIAGWRQQYPKLSIVDLRYEQQVVLRQSDVAQRPSETASATAPQPTEPAASDAQPANHAAETQANANNSASNRAANSVPSPAVTQAAQQKMVASVGPSQIAAVHPVVSASSTASKTDTAKQQKPSPKSTKDLAGTSKPVNGGVQSTHDVPKVMDTASSKSSTIRPQPLDGRVVKTALPVEQSTPGKATKNSAKPAATSGRAKKVSATKNKKSATKSSVSKSKDKSKISKKNTLGGKQKKSAANDKPSVKKTSAPVTHSEHPATTN